ncbi:DUF2835 domain-containing protein [Malonomonas rubra]|uniref:DUF2835 domain-containing protein n=1 Tax=Malonomonas rubra TaxID=57040 RepID=UPI0026EF7396|nr:DUF2835 domain-containing protein [Malonomonas rubra]
MMSAARQNHYRFSVQISQQQYMKYYQGVASTVQGYSENGQLLRFPASRLRPFLTHSGIQGRFQLTVSAENRFVEPIKLH